MTSEIIEATPADHDPFSDGELAAAAPLSPSMRELWLAVQLGGEPANLAYNEVVEIRFDGDLDPERLEQALEHLLRRHEAVRSTFSPQGDFLLIQRDASVRLERSRIDAADVEAALRDLRQRETSTPFDLARGPLCRFELVEVEPGRHHLFLRMHHLACDGWSFGLFMSELADAYRALGRGESPVSETPASLASIMQADATYQSSPEARANLNWWVEHLRDLSEPLDLPTDFTRPSVRTFDSARLDRSLDADLVGRIRKLGAKRKCTFLVTMQAAFAALIHRLTGRTDFVVGMPAAGQPMVGAESTLGHFVMMLPIRLTVSPDQGFDQLLKDTKNSLLQALDHRRITFGELVERLPRSPDASRVPLIPVTFNLDPPTATLDFGPEVETSWFTVPRRYDPFEIFLNAVDRRSSVLLELNYNTNLFRRETIERWLDTFESLLWAIDGSPETPLAELDILPESDRALHASLLDTQAPFDPEETLVARFHAAAETNPTAVAIESGEQTWTYGRLRDVANSMAAALLARDVKPGDRVAVHLPRTPDLVAVLLAILQCRAAYVPLDPALPTERKQTILDLSQPCCVIGSEGDPFDAVVPIDGLHGASGPASAPTPRPAAEDLAYVMFTSGSTGRPKGVAIEHGALSNFLDAMQQELRVVHADRLLAITTVSFDISVLELFVPLSCGATVVLASTEMSKEPSQLRERLERGDITIFQATPVTYRMLLTVGWQSTRGLRAVCGGEALPEDLAGAVRRRVDRLVNAYGPTECTVWAFMRVIDDDRVTLGRPIRNVTAAVVDDRGQPVPTGVPGELWLGGAQLARGYFNAPELTAERFVHVRGRRWYRTGDLVRLLPTGELDFIGRADDQVKVRGFRIELKEIESQILGTPGVNSAHVLTETGADGFQRLVAFFMGTAAANDLREALSRTLPAYMIPDRFFAVSSFPTTPNGKVDRRALLALSRSDAPGSAGEPRPSPKATESDNPAERAMAEVWREVLGTDDFGPTDEFFEAGGNSLQAVKLFARIRECFGKSLPVSTILTAGTVRALVDQLGAERVGERSASLGTSPGPSSAQRFFFVHDGFGEIIPYRALSKGLQEDFDVFGLGPESAANVPTVHATIEEMAEAYTRRIVDEHPEGPCWVGGLCAGGVIAFEIVRNLERRGRPVAGLVLLDAASPLATPTHHDQRTRIARFGRALQKANGSVWQRAVHILEESRDRIGRLIRFEAESRVGDYLERVRYEMFRRAVHEGRLAELPPFLQNLSVFSVYSFAERRYRPRGAISSPIVLVRASEGDGADTPMKAFHREAALGWEGLTTGRIRTFDAPGGHSTMLQEPNVTAIADFLKDLALRQIGRPPAEEPGASSFDANDSVRI